MISLSRGVAVVAAVVVAVACPEEARGAEVEEVAEARSPVTRVAGSRGAVASAAMLVMLAEASRRLHSLLPAQNSLSLVKVPRAPRMARRVGPVASEVTRVGTAPRVVVEVGVVEVVPAEGVAVVVVLVEAVVVVAVVVVAVVSS